MWGAHTGELGAVRARCRGREVYLRYDHGVKGGLERWEPLKSTVLAAELGFSHLPPAASRREANGTRRDGGRDGSCDHGRELPSQLFTELLCRGGRPPADVSYAGKRTKT